MWNVSSWNFHVYNENENFETQQIHSQSEHVLCLIDKWDCTVGEATQWNQAIDKIFLDNVAWHCHN